MAAETIFSYFPLTVCACPTYCIVGTFPPSRMKTWSAVVDTDAGFLQNLFSVTFSVDLHNLIGLLAVFIDIHVDGLYICLSLCFRNCDINELYLKKQPASWNSWNLWNCNCDSDTIPGSVREREKKKKKTKAWVSSIHWPSGLGWKRGKSMSWLLA